jgi:hypothetical protein
MPSYLELLFLTVFAFPNASRTGLDCERKVMDELQSNKKIVIRTRCLEIIPEALASPRFALQMQPSHPYKQDNA